MRNVYEYQRFQDFRFKVKQTIQSSKNWVRSHKETIIFVTPLILGVIRRRKMAKNKYSKDLYCYDKSLGHYWKLRKPLSNNDWIEIDKRKRNGEYLSDILKEMNVLK